MREFRKKQKRLYALLKTSVIISAVFLLVYIGVQPYVAKLSDLAAVICNYICDFLVIGVLVLVFMYYSKYGKCDSFLSSVENEISDAGYYLTSRSEKERSEYISSMYDDLQCCKYSMSKNIEITEFDFEFKALKKKEFFYAASIDNVDRNDVLAYLDSVIYDITVQNIFRKGDAVLCIVTDKAQDDAIALSKMVTPLGKKEQLKIAIAICEISSGRVYFLGNVKTKCQQMIANFVMNCDLPIKEQYIGKERLPFQDELEDRMKSFNIKDFKAGNFTVH
ncbi:MAG: hypothetical protein J1E36_01470 [Eubacterium sp.]|nr:hypothetical protein [Eubacterium sp.]